MVDLMVLVGASGSGKSTWAKQWQNDHPDYVIVSTDNIREELFGDAADQRDPQIVFGYAYSRIRLNLMSGLNVVFDATNLRRRDRKRLIKMMEDIPNIIFTARYFNKSYKECCANQELRDRKVSPLVIAQQLHKLQTPTLDECFIEIKEV